MTPRRRLGGSCSPRPTTGFALLEAIVALALLAGTGIALFSWINQNLQQASRLRERDQQVRLQSTAQQLVETVNPMHVPNGRIEINGVVVDWTSTPLQPAMRNATVLRAGDGPWSVGLYALHVLARDRRSGVEASFEQWRIGTLRVEPAPPVSAP